MREFNLDLREQQHPFSLMEAMDTLRQLDDGGRMTILCGDPVSRSTILDALRPRSSAFDVADREGYYEMTFTIAPITKTPQPELDEEGEPIPQEPDKNRMVVIPYEALPGCDEALGKKLIANFICGILRSEPMPQTIALYGSAVKLAAPGGELVHVLQEFAAHKCQVLVETDSLRAYGLYETCRVGRAVFFGKIRDEMMKADLVVRP